ncbi:MAG: two-component system LytT family sensor kinase [Rhodothermales bacterium]|jgi:two-component system LytT family sensor kinase
MNWNIQNTTGRRLLVVSAVGILTAALIVFGTTAQTYVDLTMRDGRHIQYWSLVQWPAVWWFAWVPVATASFELAWRFPIVRSKWASRTTILVAGGVLAFAFHVGLQMASMFLPVFSDVHDSMSEMLSFHIVISMYLNVFIYATVVGLVHGLQAYRRSQERAITAARLETELARARLDTLRMQLHPHFLFNTLNGISTLLYRDHEAADVMLTRLARLLRRALDRSDMHEVTLGEEIDFLQEYLAIEQIRFGDALKVDINIAPGLKDLLVPTFVLQPIVENSIKHGIVPNGNAGRIAVTASANGTLILEVTDDGPGLKDDDATVTSGVGLANLQDRLDALHGNDYSLDFEDAAPSGLSVRIKLPMRRA